MFGRSSNKSCSEEMLLVNSLAQKNCKNWDFSEYLGSRRETVIVGVLNPSPQSKADLMRCAVFPGSGGSTFTPNKARDMTCSALTP
jgi:hypothetical protein